MKYAPDYPEDTGTGKTTKKKEGKGTDPEVMTDEKQLVPVCDELKDKSLHKAFNKVMTMVNADVPVFMVGPAGTGKTTLAKQVAINLGVDFYYAGSVESAFQLRGFVDAHGNIVKTPFREAYENGGLFLFDEMDASDPQAIVSMHSALDNGVLDAPDGMIKKHENFRYVAAGNTWGHGASLDYVGRNALDGATLDRYAVTYVDYDAQLERKIVENKFGESALPWLNTVQQAREAVKALELRHIVSTRAAINGAALLDAGMEFADVFKHVILKGLSQDDAAKLTAKVKDIADDIALLADTDGLDDLKESIESLAVIMQDIEGARETLEKSRRDMEDVLYTTGDTTRSLTAELKEATTSIESARDSVKILKKINKAVPEVTEAAKKALKKLKAA